MADIIPSVNIGNDISFYRITGAVADRYYTTPVDGLNLATVIIANDTLYAIPFIAPKTITLDTIAINVTTGTTPATSNVRLGIYVDDGNLYPGALLLDAGAVSSTNPGVKTIAINQQLNKNTLYWLVLVSDRTPTLRATTTASVMSIFGYDNTLGTTPGTGYAAVFVYAPLPDPYPAGATLGSGTTPLVFVRLSA